MQRTTIAVTGKTRDRLKSFGQKGMTYDEILALLMNEVQRDRFVNQMRRLADDGHFVPLDSL